MSTRSKIRKERREALRTAVKEEMRERTLQETARMRKTFKILGVALLTLAVGIGIVIGGIKMVKNINAVIAGPFGSIKASELSSSNMVTLDTTMGQIKIELDDKNTPKTAANFVLLAKEGFYDGVAFHRVIKDFMIQTGDPNSKDEDPDNDGTGGPNYKFDDEKVVGEYTRGTVAMANSGPNTNGSQFFIVHQDTNLPKNYVIFGKVVEGIETVDAIANVAVQENAQKEVSRPVEPIVVNKVTIDSK